MLVWLLSPRLVLSSSYGEIQPTVPPLWCDTGLGALFFLFYICMKLLGEIIHYHGLRYHQFTDDTQLYIAATPPPTSDPSDLVADFLRLLEAVMAWMASAEP